METQNELKLDKERQKNGVNGGYLLRQNRRQKHMLRGAKEGSPWVIPVRCLNYPEKRRAGTDDVNNENFLDATQ